MRYVLECLLANPRHWGAWFGVFLLVQGHLGFRASAKGQESPWSEDLEPGATPQQGFKDLAVTVWEQERFRCHRKDWTHWRRIVCPRSCFDVAVASRGKRQALGLLCCHKPLKAGWEARLSLGEKTKTRVRMKWNTPLLVNYFHKNKH